MPDRPNGVPSYSAPRCPVAPPCAAPTRPARDVCGFWIRQVNTNYIVRAFEETFERLFSNRWTVTARVVLLPNRPNGVPSYSAPRCPVAPPCAAPTGPARGVSGFRIRKIPRHDLHEKGVQRQIGVGTHVSCQERRAIFVLLIKLWSNASPPLVLFPRRFYPNMPCMKRAYREK